MSVPLQSLWRYINPFIKPTRVLSTLRKERFENIVGKEENAGNQHFLSFQQYFPHFQRQIH